MEISVKELAGKLRNGENVVDTLEAKGEAAVRELVAMLKKENDEDTVNASFALEALTMHHARPGADAERAEFAACLASCLKDCCADEVAKCVVIKAIQLCGGDAEVPALAAELAKPHVRDYAIMALTTIGTENAKKALLEAAEAAESDVALEYVTAFATLKVADAATLLTRLWRTADAFHRVNIMDALAEIGYDAAFCGMLDALDSPSETERAGARAALAKLVRNLECREMAEGIARQYDTREPGEASIAVMLDGVGDRRTIMPRIMQEIAHGDYVRREAMLTLLLNQKDDDVSRKLMELADSSSAEVRAAIVRNLGRRGDKRAVSFVTCQVTNDDAAVRAAAFEALAMLDEAVASDVVLEALVSGRQEDAAVLKETMAPLAVDGFVANVASIIPKAKGELKAAALGYLAARGYLDGRAFALCANCRAEGAGGDRPCGEHRRYFACA